MEYIECERLPNIGYCSDNDCPCSVTQIQHGTGYLYISPEVVKFRKNALTQAGCRKKLDRLAERNEYLSLQEYEPILICIRGAKRRNLDLKVAAEDARVWWETQKAPLRATPFAVKAITKSTNNANAIDEKQERSSSKQNQKPLSYSENEYLNNSIKRNFHDSSDYPSLKDRSHLLKNPRTYEEESSIDVDVVAQYAGTPLEELALKMDKNTTTSYSKTDYSTTNTSVPLKSQTDTFHRYDQSLLPPHPNERRKIHFKTPSSLMKFIKNSTPIVLTVFITAFFSFIILKFTDIQSYIMKKFEKIQVSFKPEETREEIIIEKPDKHELTLDFFNNFYSFKDNRYQGTIQFSDVTNESGYYEQEVFVIGKANKFIVTGSFAYNKEKIVFRPDGKNRDIIWMLRSLHLDLGEAYFYDPEKEQNKDSEISLEVKKLHDHEIIVSSDPAGATIIFKDSILGQTPFSLKNPQFHGLYQFIIEKEGYNTEKCELEFTGGVVKKHLELTGQEDSSYKEVFTTEEGEKNFDSLFLNSSVSLSSASEPQKKSITEENGTLGTIFLSSLPPKAEVYMDGVKIGTTNEDYCQITAGTHTMRFVKGKKELVKKMTFTAGRNPSQLVHLE